MTWPPEASRYTCAPDQNQRMAAPSDGSASCARSRLSCVSWTPDSSNRRTTGFRSRIGAMKRFSVLGILLTVGALSIGVAASQAPATPQGPHVVDIEKLKDNLYVLTSSTPGNQATFSGGNVAVFITDGGVTLVDSKLAGWGQGGLAKVKRVSNNPY